MRKLIYLLIIFTLNSCHNKQKSINDELVLLNDSTGRFTKNVSLDFPHDWSVYYNIEGVNIATKSNVVIDGFSENLTLQIYTINKQISNKHACQTLFKNESAKSIRNYTIVNEGIFVNKNDEKFYLIEFNIKISPSETYDGKLYCIIDDYQLYVLTYINKTNTSSSNYTSLMHIIESFRLENPI